MESKLSKNSLERSWDQLVQLHDQGKAPLKILGNSGYYVIHQIGEEETRIASMCRTAVVSVIVVVFDDGDVKLARVCVRCLYF